MGYDGCGRLKGPTSRMTFYREALCLCPPLCVALAEPFHFLSGLSRYVQLFCCQAWNNLIEPASDGGRGLQVTASVTDRHCRWNVRWPTLTRQSSRTATVHLLCERMRDNSDTASTVSAAFTIHFTPTPTLLCAVL